MKVAHTNTHAMGDKYPYPGGSEGLLRHTLVLPSDHDLLAGQHVRLERPREVLDEHRRAALVRDLVLALRVEELACGLRPGGDAARARHRNRVVGAELDVGVQEVVGDGVRGRGEALGPPGVVGEDVVGAEGGEGGADGGDVERRGRCRFGCRHGSHFG